MKIQHLRRLLADALGLEQFEIEGLVQRLTPIIVVDDITPGGEQKEGPRWAMGQSDKAAVAGEYGISHLQNPASSGILVELYDIWLATAAGVGFSVGFAETEEATASPTSLLNRYLGTVAAPGSTTANVTEGSDPASGIAAGDTLWYLTTATTPFHIALDGSVVLRPGTGIRAVADTVNSNIKVAWRWREVTEK